MMKAVMKKFVHVRLIGISMLLLLILALGSQAMAQSGFAVMVQESPVGAGILSPGSGVIQASVGEMISLKAVPKPGYRFMYWVGDVSDSQAYETTIRVDSPKLIIAVFERDEFEIPSESSGGGGGEAAVVENAADNGSSSAIRRAAGYRIDHSTSTGGGYIRDFPEFPFTPNDPSEPDPINDELPVPDEQVPEPATLVLIGAGSIALLRNRNRK